METCTDRKQKSPVTTSGPLSDLSNASCNTLGEHRNSTNNSPLDNNEAIIETKIEDENSGVLALQDKEPVTQNKSENGLEKKRSNKPIADKKLKIDVELLECSKTKKQPQTLKLCHVDHAISTNSKTIRNEIFGAAEVSEEDSNIATVDLAALNDNAVLAHELHMDLICRDESIIGNKLSTITSVSEQLSNFPLSPHSNSNDNSSSSSTCSNFSPSGLGSKSCRAKYTSALLIDKSTPIIKDVQSLFISDLPLNLHTKKEGEHVSHEKSRFEEVENKLEEMFAGIEDESLQLTDVLSFPKTPANEVNTSGDISTVNKDNEKKNGITTLVVPPPPTKAAKKSTPATDVLVVSPTPLIISPPSPQKSEAQVQIPITTNTIDIKLTSTKTTARSPTINTIAVRDTTSITAITTPTTSSIVFQNRIRTPRRLSVGINPDSMHKSLPSEEGHLEPSLYIANLKNDTKTKPVPERTNELMVQDEIPSTSSEVSALSNKAFIDTKTLPKGRQAEKGVGTRRAKRCKKVSKTKGLMTGNKIRKVTSKNKQKSRRRRHFSEDEEVGTHTRDPTACSVEGKYRSPFILVKRDGSINVINTPTAEDAASEKPGAKGKKASLAKYAHERKNIRGLHSSTLSIKYDADTTDSSWICVFCKHGPHKLGLGDLFGPYLIASECEEYRAAARRPDALNLDALFSSKRRRVDMVQSHPRNLPAVPVGQWPLALSNTKGGKKKRKLSVEDDKHISVCAESSSLPTKTNAEGREEESIAQQAFYGMCKVTENSFEVWLHEDCAVWAPDVYLVGSRVTGLDATVWNSTNYHCALCSKMGAIVCCLQRDCKLAAHVPCARQSGWTLDEATMRVHCRRHASHNLISQNTLNALADSFHYMHAFQTMNAMDGNLNSTFMLPPP